jgi:DNA primase
MKCHNCQRSSTFETFLKGLDPGLYNAYRTEKFLNTRPAAVRVVPPEPTQLKRDEQWQQYLTKATANPDAMAYLRQRQIPECRHDEIYFTENLNDLKVLFPDYANTKFAEEPRIVLPVLSQTNTLIGIISRAMGASALRYINLKRDTKEELLYNINSVRLSEMVYVFEGAFDSMFIDNSIAVDGSSFAKVKGILQKDKSTLVYDNTPRNIELIKAMTKMVADGWRICIWPKNLPGKDINKMVEEGMTPDAIKHIIDTHSFRGLTCELEFAKWKER